MRIIKENLWIKRYDCIGQDEGKKGCGSTLEVGLGDLRYFRGLNDRRYDRRYVEPSVCFKCPVCNTINYIPKTDWPPSYANLGKGFEL